MSYNLQISAIYETIEIQVFVCLNTFHKTQIMQTTNNKLRGREGGWFLSSDGTQSQSKLWGSKAGKPHGTSLTTAHHGGEGEGTTEGGRNTLVLNPL